MVELYFGQSRIPSKRPPPTFLRNLCLRGGGGGGGRLQGTLQYHHLDCLNRGVPNQEGDRGLFVGWLLNIPATG